MSLAWSRLRVGNVPVMTKVLPDKGLGVTGAGSPSSHVTPQASSCSTTSRLCGWSKKVRRLLATMGPTSLTVSNCASLASMMASSLPKCLANSLAVASPTWRMPRPNKKRGKVVALDFSSACSRFCADLSAMRSRPAKAVKPNLYKSGRVRMILASTSCSTNLSPRPSTSTARRWAKCKIASLRCAPQNKPPVQR